MTVTSGQVTVDGTDAFFGRCLSPTQAISISGGTVELLNPSDTIGSLAGTGGVIRWQPASLLNLAAAVSTTFAGTLEGGRLNIGGSNQLELTGTSNSELWAFQTSTLTLNGLATQGVTLYDETATLAGSGTIGGRANLWAIHSPGNNGPGIQTFTGTAEAVLYSASSVVKWDLVGNTAVGAGSSFDQLVITAGNLLFPTTGTMTFNPVFNSAGSTVDWSNPFWNSNRSWIVFDLNAGWSSSLNSVALGGSLLDSLGNTLNPTTRGSFSLGKSGEDVVLNFVAVPEPATCGLGVIGLGLAAGVSRLRRRSRARSLANRPAGRGPSGAPEGPPPAA
jgi:hypothetical protein